MVYCTSGLFRDALSMACANMLLLGLISTALRLALLSRGSLPMSPNSSARSLSIVLACPIMSANLTPLGWYCKIHVSHLIGS